VPRDFLSSGTLLLADLQEPELCSMPIEPRFDRITRVAREALRVAAAGITIERNGDYWFKSVAGWDIEELPAKRSLCHLTREAQGPVVIADTFDDPVLARHPLVTGKPYIRFYAGVPLRGLRNDFLGTLCVFDTRPRQLSPSQAQVLQDLGAMAQREIFADATRDAQRQLVAKLGLARRDAMIDPLTRVWNRRAAFQLLREASADPRKSGGLAVGMIDVDYFKDINDTHGHQVGDEVLRKVARLIVSAVRDGDIVARYGGDEFILILQDIDEAALASLTQGIRERLHEFPIRTRAATLPISLTIGSALVTPGTRGDPEELVKRADEALRQLKRARPRKRRTAAEMHGDGTQARNDEHDAGSRYGPSPAAAQPREPHDADGCAGDRLEIAPAMGSPGELFS
jgi:diguanylate cyclase (GGDEF)-like protein